MGAYYPHVCLHFLSKLMKRIILFFVSALNILYMYGQDDLSAYLNRLFDMQDNPQAVREALSKVTPKQIESAPDSVKFDYYYLSAAVDDLEDKYTPEKISNLEKAKEICERGLDVHSAVYMEIMYALASEYEEFERYDEAFSTYQEGMIKGLSLKNAYPQKFADLIMGMATCYEIQGRLEEIPTHFRDAWEFWDKGQEPFETYNYFPLWSLQNFYYRYGEYDKAKETSREILDFIHQKVGDTHIENAEELYFYGNILREQKKYEEACAAYRKGIKVCEKVESSAKHLNVQKLLLGNLLLAYAKSGVVIEDTLNTILDDIKGNSIKTRTQTDYNNALFSLSKELNQKGNYDVANHYVSLLLRENLSEQERGVITNLKNTIEFNHNLASSEKILKDQLMSLPKGTKEWLNVARQLSIISYNKGDNEGNMKILLELYSCVTTKDTEYYAWTAYNLIGSLFDANKYNDALPICQSYQIFAEENFGDDMRYVTALNNLIVAKLKCKQLGGIKENFLSLEELYRKKHGINSFEYSVYLHNYGRYLQLSNQLEAAKNTYLKAIKLQNKIEGKPFPNTVRYLSEVNSELFLNI